MWHNNTIIIVIIIIIIIIIKKLFTGLYRFCWILVRTTWLNVETVRELQVFFMLWCHEGKQDTHHYWAKKVKEKFIMNPHDMLSSNGLIFWHFPRQISTAAVGEVEKLNCICI